MPDRPHDLVWARLGASSRHGVGVFAIMFIPKGTDIFANDQQEMVWIEADALDTLPAESEQKRLYQDFAVRRGTLLGCPINFNLLTVGWYLNEPDPGEEANVAVGDGLAMTAVRDIAAGEELTIRYSTFSG
ncbi:SET domain-containing protein [Sphingomonas sp. JC676]|uniref:SET domain-containing protein-lysine N-methyltransferase n=1 Tax=Sphingomonas sp. JC676 TaxID=2768065 RepID=UPI001657C04F|nr:SET domain-containing protein [Sphingomonas sp. JC676]MBC9033899.1 SET domain-containing protein [Sphingomonas sp. JC676]